MTARWIEGMAFDECPLCGVITAVYNIDRHAEFHVAARLLQEQFCDLADALLTEVRRDNAKAHDEVVYGPGGAPADDGDSHDDAGSDGVLTHPTAES